MITPNPQKNNQMKANIKISIYDQQINFLKYIERRSYQFKGGPKNNPLLPLYSINKSDIILPKEGGTKPENDICIKLSSSIANKTDRKPVNCVKFFSDSKKVLFGTTIGNLIIYNIYNNNTNNIELTPYYKFDPNISIRAIQFSKDESFLLTGDKNGNVNYFKEPNQQNPKKIIHNIQIHNDTITDISFSINSQKFVTSSDDKTSKIMDFFSGKNELIFKEHLGDVKSCNWNPYRNIIATGSKDQFVKIWDPNSGDVIGSLHIHKNSINRLRFNQNGNWLLSGSKDHTVKVSDIRMMKELQIFKGHDSEVNTLCWHPIHEEIFCSAGADKKIIHWKVGEDKNYIYQNAHDKEIFDLQYNKTGTVLASGGNDAFLNIWTRAPLIQ